MGFKTKLTFEVMGLICSESEAGSADCTTRSGKQPLLAETSKRQLKFVCFWLIQKVKVLDFVKPQI